MKPGNQKRVFASSTVLFSFLLASTSVAQNPKPPAASPVASPTAKSSPALKPTATTKPAASSTQTPSPSQSSNLGASQTTNSPQSTTPTWNFWEATAGNWVAILGVLLGATIAGLIAIYAPRALERYKLRLQAEQKKKEEEEQATAKVAAEAKSVKAYYEKLKQELCHLSICDLPNVPSSVNLESIYVQLQVREEETLRYAKDEEMAPLAAGEPSQLLRRSQLHIVKQAEIALSPEDTLVKFRRMVVLGDPGAGKTTMQRYLALQMAKQAEPKLPYLPVYVELGKFVESKKNDLLDFIADEWEKRYGFSNALPYLEQQLDDGKAALLLDGLDEVLGGGTQEEAQAAYKRVADEINRLATLFSAAPIVVTCRKAGWRGGLKGFQTLEVLDFSWEQIQEFVNLWFKSNSDKAEGLRQALEKNLRMQILAANPLILSLIAIVYQEDLELPERRAELYKRCLTVLLKEWDSHRDIKRFSQFSTDGKRNLLKEVAWHFHKSGKRYFPEDELLELIADFLPTINIPREDNKAILDEIAAQHGLLKVQAHGWYGFVHLTFQEYFAALAVKDNGAAALSEVIVHRHEPWWEEVILLLSEMLKDATPLLLGILGHSTGLPELPEGNLAANDDRFHSDLLLAARCLAGTPQILMNGLRDRIIADVKNLLLTSPYEFDWDRAARVLIEIGDKALINELLEMLTDKSIEPSDRRESIAKAFGDIGDRSVAQSLLGLLNNHLELDSLVRLSIVGALGALKATFAVDSLRDLLETEKEPNTRGQIIQALGKIGDKKVASSLLDMFLDTTTDLKIKSEIAQALKDLNDPSLTNPILEKLRDETIDWQVRWLLTESLEGLQETAKDSLMEILESQDINDGVRMGIAATLGTWGVRESIPHLRNALENQVVPPSLKLGNYSQSGYLWRRITRVLNGFGDNSVKQILIEKLKEKITLKNQGKPSIIEIINALYEYKPEEIAHQVLAIARGQVQITFFDVGKGMLLLSMQNFATKALLPDLRELLAERKKYGIDELGQIGIITAIAKVGDDLETVKALREMTSVMESTQDEFLRNAIYQALYNVSRRAGVRVNADGQIEELKK
ncbi:HEAT repeat domain-containing protein [Coleofasciculus sp. FACHB-T130]|uniref:HEAT repeat domain-containing protein n=1 Tax=Cyanophyceae TaxID=3028117 RepID=UPI001682A3CD|nr:HEAT repeat domain-containing protein [Coleofasciculus sp. FACHB-T130]MBD1881421.1 HEAT repeat domain-containing protein [Coleofasciculus sp. FACHB-T130]